MLYAVIMYQYVVVLTHRVVWDSEFMGKCLSNQLTNGKLGIIILYF